VKQITVASKTFTLTPAQEVGIRALAKAYPAAAHISNSNDPTIGYVHWKVAGALLTMGLAQNGGFEALAFTPTGRGVARQLGLQVEEAAS
jgi:hypothetical protein